jgi:ATP-dependent Clp protease ATP-binding subunit ClpC
VTAIVSLFILCRFTGDGVDAKLNDKVERVIALAEKQAQAHGHDFVGVEHLLLGLLDLGGGIAAKTLESQGITIDTVRWETERVIVRGSRRPYDQLPLTRQAKKALKISGKEAASLGARFIGAEHILLGLLKQRGGLAVQVLGGLGLSFDRTRGQVEELTRPRAQRQVVRNPESVSGGANPGGGNRRPTGVPPLGRLGRNLTYRAAAGELYPAVGRDQEIGEVLRVLSASPPGHPLLIGYEADCLTVLDGVAQRMTGGNVPQALAGKELCYRDPDGFTAAVIEEAQARGDVVLAVGRLPEILADPSLRQALARGSGGIIGTVSPDYHRQDSIVNGAVYGAFSLIHVPAQLTAYDLGKLDFELRAAAHG